MENRKDIKFKSEKYIETIKFNWNERTWTTVNTGKTWNQEKQHRSKHTSLTIRIIA